jgi:hypothetical protein
MSLADTSILAAGVKLSSPEKLDARTNNKHQIPRLRMNFAAQSSGFARNDESAGLASVESHPCRKGCGGARAPGRH